MTRRYPPTSISVGHGDTQIADWQHQAARPHFVAEPAVPAPAPEPSGRPKPTRPATTPDRPVLSARRPAAPKRAAKPAPSKPTLTKSNSASDVPDEATIAKVIDYVFGGEE